MSTDVRLTGFQGDRRSKKPRETLIQAYSRQSAKPATEKGKTEIKL